MYNCPHCHQEMKSFVFFCIRCSQLVGQVTVEGQLLTLWWLDINLNQSERILDKTLKRGGNYLDVSSISSGHPTANMSEITFTLTDGSSISQRLLEFFEQVASPNQEWRIG